MADDTQRHIPVLADRLVVHVDLHDGGFRAQAFAVTHSKIKWGAHNDDEIGFFKSVPTRTMEMMRVARRQHPAGGAIEVSRYVQGAYQIDRLLVAAR